MIQKLLFPDCLMLGVKSIERIIVDLTWSLYGHMLSRQESRDDGSRIHAFNATLPFLDIKSSGLTSTILFACLIMYTFSFITLTPFI